MLVQTWYQWSIPRPYSSQHMPGENKNQYLKGEGIGGRGRHILIAAKGSTVVRGSQQLEFSRSLNYIFVSH